MTLPTMLAPCGDFSDAGTKGRLLAAGVDHNPLPAKTSNCRNLEGQTIAPALLFLETESVNCRCQLRDMRRIVRWRKVAIPQPPRHGQWRASISSYDAEAREEPTAFGYTVTSRG